MSMNETLIFDPLMCTLDARRCTVVRGRDWLSDPGAVLLRRYLPVLAVTAAPFTGPNGEGAPLNPLDQAAEWRALLRIVAATTEQQTEVSTRLALARLIPPTADDLRAVLRAGMELPNGLDAFRVVHVVAHGENDSITLEDVAGGEALLQAEQMAALFEESGVRVVVLEGCFSHRLAHRLIDTTPVQAVVGTRRRGYEAEAVAFWAAFYAQLTAGSSVRIAYRAALDAVGEGAERYELVANDDLHEIALDMPAARIRAALPLIADGMPPMVHVPQVVGFVGQRDELKRLEYFLFNGPHTLMALHGLGGIGKTWLAAAMVTRFGWQFPDGIRWFRCNAMTAAREVMTAIAQLLGLPAYAPGDEIAEAINERQALIVLDGVDSLESWAEQERLTTWLTSIGRNAPSRIVLVGRWINQLLPEEEDGYAQAVEVFDYREARTLAMRLAVERDLDALDVDTIDDFLEYTQYSPWLIHRGIEMIETLGIETALDLFAALGQSARDPVSNYLLHRVQALARAGDRALNVITRTQGLPDAFDAELVDSLVGDDAPEQVETLLREGLLWCTRQTATDTQCAQYQIAPDVRRFLTERMEPSREQQDLLDRQAIAYLARTWPAAEDARHTVWDTTYNTALDLAMQMRVNNVRTLIQRQLRPDINLDLDMMARILTISAPAFRAAGLAEEFIGYATGFHERLPEGSVVARLQIEMGNALSVMPGHADDAGYQFRTLVAASELDPVTSTQANRAYGQYLIATGQVVAAEKMLERVVNQLLDQRDPRTGTNTAHLAHDLANVLALQGHYGEALEYYELALRGFAALQAVVPAIRAQCDYSEALIHTNDPARAEDLLRRALQGAEQHHCLDLAAEVRVKLAELHTGRASSARRAHLAREERDELLAAEALLSAAITDGLTVGVAETLARRYLALGRAISRLERLDEALLHVRRGLDLFERSGQVLALAETLVMVGQLQMARGDSVLALDALHAALEHAHQNEQVDVMGQAAAVLVRVYQIRARHVPQAGSDFLEDTLARAQATLRRLDELRLDDQVAALDAIIAELDNT